MGENDEIIIKIFYNLKRKEIFFVKRFCKKKTKKLPRKVRLNIGISFCQRGIRVFPLRDKIYALCVSHGTSQSGIVKLTHIYENVSMRILIHTLCPLCLQGLSDHPGSEPLG